MMTDLFATLAAVELCPTCGQEHELPPGWMHRPFFESRALGRQVVIYPWKIIGYFGVLMFGLRWLPQLIASRRAKKVTMPRIFWIMSVLGSLSLLTYFFFGKPDSVGVLSTLFPSLVACYNLVLDIRNSIRPHPPAAEPEG